MFLLGAFGHLHCLDLASGRLLWASHLPIEFDATLPPWGYSSSPLLVGGRLIVQPGGAEASIVALDPATGDVVWERPGAKAAYAGLIAANVGGVTQIIGCDEEGFGGWDAASGLRLWKLPPENPGDFLVPTPLMSGGRLLLTGENNGTRVHAFDPAGRIVPAPLARDEVLAPDAHTPVAVGARIVGLAQKFCCLDAATLGVLWSVHEPDMGSYASMITDGKRLVLTLSERGVLFLHDVSRAAPVELGRLRVCAPGLHVLSHPALVGRSLYLRLGDRVARLDL